MQKKWIICIQIIICLIFASCSKSEITVSIIGESTDKINEVVGINIHEVSESLEVARRKVETTSAAIETELLDLNIDKEAIYINGSHSGEIEGRYFISKDFQVIIPEDIEKGVLIERVTLAGASGIHSAWGIMDPNMQSDNLPVGYENILAAARDKAEVIAIASDSAVGKILSIEEQNQYNDTVMFRVTYELKLK